jgi:predicted  nucleic acid-binding Zn-ribbon protein
MPKDIEVYMEAARLLEKQVENAIVEIERRDEKIKGLQDEVKLMHQKVINTEKDRDQMRSIMTQNITESNAKLNSYLGEIAELKAALMASRVAAKG